MKYQLVKLKGRPYFQLRFTDPRTHERHKHSTGKTTKTEAEAWVFEFFKNYNIGDSKQASTTVGALVKAMLDFYEDHKPDRWIKMKQAWDNRLKDKFADIDAREFSFHDYQDYKKWGLGKRVPRRHWPAPKPPRDRGRDSRHLGRFAWPLKPNTINRDLSVLSRMYSWALEVELITYGGPKLVKFSEKEYKRTGTITQAEFDAMVAQNPPIWLRGMMTMGYDIANRRGELVNLKCHQVDLVKGWITLAPADTKNKRGRGGPITQDMRKVLEACMWGKQPDDLVFTREDRNQPRRPVGDFRKTWKNLLKAAGIERKVLFHDFRRSGATNMIDRGVDPVVARGITGHLSDVFADYQQVSKAALLKAMEQIEAGKKNEREKAAAKLEVQ